MSQEDFSIANSDGATVRVDINSNLQALATLSSGASAPSTTFAYMWWADTTTGLLKQRNAANSAWVTKGTLAEQAAELGSDNVFTKSQTWKQGADVASAAALAVNIDGNMFDVTGTTTITSINSKGVGTLIVLQFDGALTLTHHATDMKLQGGQNRTTAAGDIIVLYEYASGDWREVSYLQAGALNLQDRILQRPILKDYGETEVAIGATGGGTQDFDLTLGNVFSAIVDTSANTFTFSNPTASGDACSFTLILTDGGSQTVNWPASVDWAGGTAPTLTTSGVDVLTFITIDGGTTWYGFAAGLDLQ